MKCARCKAEIKVGSMYCSVCGREAQIVSDDQLLEEEYLNHLLKDEPAPKNKDTNENGKKKKRKKKKKGLIIGLSIALLIAAIVAGYFIISYQNKNSFAYQYNHGVDSAEDKNYEKALVYLKQALHLDKSSLKTRIRLAEVYIAQEETEDAIEILMETVELDENYEDAYDYLIQIYEEEKDYKSIADLNDYTSKDSILTKISKYSSEPPVFEKKEGKYYEYIDVELTGEDGATIYYTTDGSSPIENGIVYKEPITVKEGVTKIKAAAKNEYGVFSKEINNEYVVELKKPGMPEVEPDSGSFNEKQSVVVEVPEGCSVYYTWDGSAPDESSEKYVYPLQIPEGNNILSLILVNEYGLKSDVLRCNYIYLPQ